MKSIMFKNIGRRLSKMRRAQGLTQATVAEKLGYGTSQFISNFERGLCGPPIHQLRNLVKLYKIDKSELHRFLSKEHSEFLKRSLRI